MSPKAIFPGGSEPVCRGYRLPGFHSLDCQGQGAVRASVFLTLCRSLPPRRIRFLELPAGLRQRGLVFFRLLFEHLGKAQHCFDVLLAKFGQHLDY